MIMENLIESDYGFFVEIDSYSNNKNEREKYFKKLKYKINQLSVIEEEEMEEMEHNEESNYHHPKKPIKKSTSAIILHYSTATVCTISLFYFIFYLF